MAAVPPLQRELSRVRIDPTQSEWQSVVLVGAELVRAVAVHAEHAVDGHGDQA